MPFHAPLGHEHIFIASLPFFAFWFGIISINIVKIMNWLVKLYDFTSQYIFLVLNQLKNMKSDKFKLNCWNWLKSCKIMILNMILWVYKEYIYCTKKSPHSVPKQINIAIYLSLTFNPLCFFFHSPTGDDILFILQISTNLYS